METVLVERVVAEPTTSRILTLNSAENNMTGFFISKQNTLIVITEANY